MRFTEYLTEHVMLSQTVEQADLPILTEVRRQVQSYSSFTGETVKRNMDRLLTRTATELQDWAEHIRPFAEKNGYRTQVLDKILADPQKAAKSLIRKYVMDHVGSTGADVPTMGDVPPTPSTLQPAS
jgi:hypothetical protein